MSCQSVTVVLTLVQTKQIRLNIHKWNDTKNTVQTIQNTVNTSMRITKTPTHYKTHRYTHPHITKQVKTTTVQYPKHVPSLVHSTRTYLPMKMEQTKYSETSAYKIQTPGNHPKESIQPQYKLKQTQC